MSSSTSNLKSNNGLSALSDLEIRKITLSDRIITPVVDTPYVGAKKINLFGSGAGESTITLGETGIDGKIEGFVGRDLRINSNNNLVLTANTELITSADNTRFRSGGVDKIVITNSITSINNQCNLNNITIVQNIATGNQFRCIGTGFDHLVVSNNQIIGAPDGITPRFAVFNTYSGFSGDFFLFNTAITAQNYSFAQAGATFNRPLTFPNFTTGQRNALTPANGMVIYNTTTSKLQVYAGGVWVDLH